MNFSMIALTVTPNKITEASLLPVSIHFIFKFPQLFQRRLLVLVVTMLESLPRPVLCCYGCGSNPTTSSSPSPLTSFHPSGRARGQSDIQFSSVQSLSRVWLSATPWIAARQASLSITMQCLLYNIMVRHPFQCSKLNSMWVPSWPLGK